MSDSVVATHAQLLPRHQAGRWIIAGLLASLAVLLTTSGASAHERRAVGGYQVVVGFLNEPAIVEEPNGLDLRVSKGEGTAAQPVEGLANALKAEVRYGDRSMPLTLEPRFGQPGAYRADFIPTAEGAYTFVITGTIEGTPINETFTSGPNTFGEAESRSAMSFPNQVGTVGAVAATAQEARDAADTATLLGIAGLVVGALGLVVGAAGLMLARKARPATLATPSPAAVRAEQEREIEGSTAGS